MKLIEIVKKKINAINSAVFEYCNYSDDKPEIAYITEEIYLRGRKRIEVLEKENSFLLETISNKTYSLAIAHKELKVIKKELELVKQEYSKSTTIAWTTTICLTLYHVVVTLYNTILFQL